MSSLEFQRRLVGLRQQLYYFALGLTKDRDDAQDLLQDCFLRALTNRDKFQDNTNFKAWLFTIMRHSFINERRRNKRTAAVMDRIVQEREQVSAVQMPGSPERRMVRTEVERGLARLDGAFREPFTMHHEGFKYHEIARKLGIPIGTVKSRIFQARKRLMTMLSDRSMQGA